MHLINIFVLQLYRKSTALSRLPVTPSPRGFQLLCSARRKSAKEAQLLTFTNPWSLFDEPAEVYPGIYGLFPGEGGVCGGDSSFLSGYDCYQLTVRLS